MSAPDPRPGGPTCLAPAVAMHFGLVGHVHACCQNGRYSYGAVAEQSLAEIWSGDARRAMAAALARGDYPTGCEGCEVEHGLGQRGATPAVAFDQFASGDTDPAWPRQLEFTLSNRCNLACVQCNGENSSTIRAQREGRPPLPAAYGEDFFAQLPPFLEHAEVVSFLGGEPFLAPEARRVLDLLLAATNRPVVRVTTNVTVWSDAVERYLRDLRMHVALSIDGATAETYEAVRVGARYERVVTVRDRILAVAAETGAYVHLNYCLLRANWHEVGAFFAQADALDLDANVIPVHEPADHSLFTLDLAALDPIVAALEAEDGWRAGTLGRNRERWSAVVALLRQQRDLLAAGDPTETRLVRIRRARTGADERDLADRRRRAGALLATAEQALRGWSSDGWIEVTTDGPLVTGVTAPGWAAPLAPERWVGTDVAELRLVASDGLGVVEVAEVGDRSGGEGLLFETDSVLVVGERRVRFRTVFAPGLGRMLIATPDAAALAAVDAG